MLKKERKFSVLDLKERTISLDLNDDTALPPRHDATTISRTQSVVISSPSSLLIIHHDAHHQLVRAFSDHQVPKASTLLHILVGPAGTKIAIVDATYMAPPR